MSKRRDHRPLGDAIKAERERQKLGRGTVAARAGVKEQWLLKVESGQGNPTWGQLQRLAAAMEIPLPDLMQRIEDCEEGDEPSSAPEKRSAKKRRKQKRSRWSRGQGKEDRPQEALAKALSHTLRAQALTALAERTASPKEIADELEEALPNVSYHVRVLENLGLVELVEEEAVRGAVAHFYRAVEQEISGNPAWKWTPLSLDESGWRRVIEIQGSAVKEILREQASAERRLEKTRIDGTKGMLGTLLFQAAPKK